MNSLKLSLLIFLITFLGIQVRATNNFTLFAGGESKQIQFAVGELQTALIEKGLKSVVAPFSKVSQFKNNESNIVLLNISDKVGSQLLRKLKIKNIQELNSGIPEIPEPGFGNGLL